MLPHDCWTPGKHVGELQPEAAWHLLTSLSYCGQSALAKPATKAMKIVATALMLNFIFDLFADLVVKLREKTRTIYMF